MTDDTILTVRGQFVNLARKVANAMLANLADVTSSISINIIQGTGHCKINTFMYLMKL